MGDKAMEEFTRRFWTNVQKTDSCWLWLASKTDKGYGQTSRNYKHLYAHRVSWELAGKALIKGKTLDHLCRNRACVNPDHLEQVTHRQNILRGVGLTAQNAGKQVCKYGHPFNRENTAYATARRYRVCKQCALRRGRLYVRKVA